MVPRFYERATQSEMGLVVKLHTNMRDSLSAVSRGLWFDAFKAFNLVLSGGASECAWHAMQQVRDILLGCPWCAKAPKWSHCAHCTSRAWSRVP